MNLKLSILLILMTVNTAFAIESQKNNPTTTNENIISCAILNGDLTHRIYKRNDGIKGFVSFPVRSIELTPKELEANKLAYQKSINDNSPIPPDNRNIGVLIPLTSSNILSSDQKFLKKKTTFFKSIFPDTKKEIFIPYGTGQLFLNFKNEDCTITNEDSLVSVHCTTNKISELNNVPIERISMHMRNTRTTELTPESSDLNSLGVERKLIPKIKNSVLAQLTFTSKGKSYQSTFSYSPNGNDRSCQVNGEKLDEFEN